MVPSLVLRYRIRQIAHSNSCVATLAAPIFFLAQDLTRGYAWRKRNTFSLSTAKVLTLTALLLLVAYAGYTPTPGHSQGNLGLPAPPLAGLLQHVRLGDVGHPHSPLIFTLRRGGPASSDRKSASLPRSIVARTN
jgi:hypothetical protein